jgi:hypothetical protein
LHALQILIVLFVTNCYRHTMSTEEEPENSGDIPDEDLCVVCLLRRRQAAFIQCGHRVCCVPCAQRVEQGSNPLCPVCRQIVTSIVRVFDSWLEHLVSQLLIGVSHLTTIPVMYLGETLWHLTTSYPNGQVCTETSPSDVFLSHVSIAMDWLFASIVWS